ncbi:MAG: 2,3,4,5-tetrahydropyridine-2,6-dicarboxylate N-succinyltransferase [Bartonella sp.]|nr:2,3,4,5-tetrahydropyridine-2,6-dicarboxylate N-succinyltransferase [Bartonella sp.]
MTSFIQLEEIIERAFNNRDSINSATKGEIRESVEHILNLLDKGEIRVAQRQDNGQWHVHQWLKKAVLLSFRLRSMCIISGGANESHWWDKIPSKFSSWREVDFKKANFRSVPGAIVRHSAYIAPHVVLMPSFVNIGAYVGEGTMIDTWASVGSCAQIGQYVHLSGGVGIGGVLEPLQEGPTIIEVVEGCIIREGSVLGMGIFIGKSTKIIDRTTGEVFIGEVPAYSVVVPGSCCGKPLPNGEMGPNLYCAVIVKRVDKKTREKTSINDLLRD